MQIVSKSPREQKAAEMRLKAKAALQQREKEQQLRRTKTAQLRALRLERDAENEVSIKGHKAVET